MRREANYATPKDELYYAGVNDRILALVPEDVRRVLDVGCAAGNLGAAIKETRPGVVVHGVEADPNAARLAKERLDRVFEADLNQALPELDGPYDCVTCGDILEHLVDPWTLLSNLVNQLAPGGRVIASIPNVRHYKVVRDLALRGRFRYCDAGIMDSTHLRFFTLTEMMRLFDGAGLRVVEHRPRLTGGNAVIRILDRALLGRLEELRAVQYTLVGVRE